MQKIKLNLAQKEAVEYTGSHLLIVAGAGTGKTAVITNKIAHLIEKGLAKPEEILALTFTDKSADEMLSRVDGMINVGYAELQISTFHAFCQRLLERFALDIGLPNQFKLLTQTDAWLLIRKHLDIFDLDYYRPLGSPAKHIHEFIRHFSKCKDELIAPADYLNYAENVMLDKDDTVEKSRLSEIANAYHTYNQLLLKNNSLDFGDLIFYTIQLLEKRPKILKLLQSRFKYILVDEFQDVNWAQYHLVRLLTGIDGHLTVVGDDDQSIYAFRGASVSNIMRFKDDYTNCKEIVLTENYRSGQEILDAAYKLIQNNNPDRLEVKLKLDKKLTSAGNQLSGQVIHMHLNTLDEEVKGVIDEISKIKETNEECSWDDFAILVRANNHAELFLNAMEKCEIPYEFISSSGLFRQPIIMDCVNFFRSIIDYRESPAVYRLLCLPFLKIGDDDMQKLLHLAKKKAISYFEALKKADEFGISAEGKKAAEKIVCVISEGMRLSVSDKPTKVLYHFLDESGYLNYLAHEENQGNREVIRQIHHLRQFFEYLSGFEANTAPASVKSFLEHFEFVLESGDKGALYQPSETSDSVNVLTVHSSKGLEFKYVFVANMVEDRFPSRNRGGDIEIPLELIKEQLPEGDSHLQEERRLFYVAITRARERVYFMSADDYGGARAKKISRFLVELGLISSQTANVPANYLQTLIPQKKDARNKGEFQFELPTAFSFSQVKSYETCPYQYKLAHILRIPSKGSASFSFGQTMHGTLYEFYLKIQELNNVQQASLFGISESNEINGAVKAPSLDELLKMYHLRWIDDWYISKKQRDDYFKKGEEILRIFYKSEEGNWSIPVCLESWFKIKVGDYLVHGRIDRVDKLPDGTLEIIDYKTGKAKEKVSGGDKEQLVIYQMAAEQLPEYQTIGATSRLTYLYLNDNLKISFLGNEKEKEKIKEKLKKIIGQINARDFTATPGAHKCAFCDFRDICDFRE
ncbi:ATP-dependent helicase [Patescibacteria group bacterium]|nr:ATP-dependent helicase [Patescibacteria group bacterium]